MTGDALPTLAFPEETPGKPRRRRRVWPWIVALVVVLGLLVAAWFIVDAVAKDLATKAVRQQVRSQFGLPPDQPVDVDITGPLLPQLVIGDFGEVRIAADDVTIEGLTGDVSVVLRDLSIRDGFAMSGGSATVALDQGQLRALMAQTDGFPADTVGLADPDVTMTFTLSLFGAPFPVGVALTPSAADGDLVLTPASIELGGAQVTADDVRRRFGGLADGVLRDWDVCLAQYLPAGIVLQSASVSGGELVAGFSIRGDLLTDPAQQAKGTCS